jgi:hypothetical protein
MTFAALSQAAARAAHTLCTSRINWEALGARGNPVDEVLPSVRMAAEASTTALRGSPGVLTKKV